MREKFLRGMFKRHYGSCWGKYDFTNTRAILFHIRKYEISKIYKLEKEIIPAIKKK
jgi:hypothetical protein